MMRHMDERQETFAGFEVPDPGRIRKVHRWLANDGYLDTSERPVSVLEIGYATGGLLDHLDAGGDFRKFALDLHERKPGPGVTFFQHDCNEDFDFAEGMVFDVIFAGEIVEHIYHDDRFLAQLRGLLAPDGVVALTTPNLFFAVNRLVMPLGRMPYFAWEPYHYHFYSKATLTKLFTDAGFKVRRVTSSHVLMSTRRNRLIGGVCERLGDVFPSLGAHLIVFAVKGN